MTKKTKYSPEELNEFQEIIYNKLKMASSELNALKRTLTKSGEDGVDFTHGRINTLEDGAATAEKEHLNQLAVRQQKFIKSLENALIRIKNGTYGICIDTGKLIRKERLRAVPHTMHSIDAKLNRNK